MSVTLGNPIIITSGTLSSPITRRQIAIERLYWHQPSTVTSGYGVSLRKVNMSGAQIAQMTVEADGQSQVLNMDGKQVVNLYCESVGTGTLYIYQK